MDRSEMSSMLLKPIMRRPSQSMEEKRELTLVIGSPMVFHTAPPQPASKARMICSPQLVGGADASQNGLGASMDPAKPRTRRSRVISLMSGLRLRKHGQSGPLTVRNCIHHFAPAIYAIASGVVARIVRAAGGGTVEQVSVANLDVAELI